MTSILRSSVHFASSADSGLIRLILGAWPAEDMVKCLISWVVRVMGTCGRIDQLLFESQVMVVHVRDDGVSTEPGIYAFQAPISCVGYLSC